MTGADGLTAVAVAERVERGEVNGVGERTSRTFGEIARANLLTRFNAILGSMFVLILVFGSPLDGLFGIVLVANALIGIVQELRAKRTLDALAVLNAPVARVVRDGALAEIAVEDVVLDDLLELRAGDQVPADLVVRAADGLEVDESLLTGESDAVGKHPGDSLLSGSIVVAGVGRAQATAVGEAAYARRLAAEARQFTVVSSDLISGINRILRLVTWVLVTVGPLLFWRQLDDEDFSHAVTGAVAGVVGMVPEGLVLLTSIAFGVAAVTLARRHVLVRELPAVEGLARVDVVCLDKTGTLTEGIVELDRVVPVDTPEPDTLAAALGALADDENANATMAAIRDAYPAPSGWARTATVPFSSARKWSAASFAGHGTWVLGGPEMVWVDAAAPVRRLADDLAAAGSRVLLLTHSAEGLDGEALPSSMAPIALVLLEEKVRPDAAETLDYFRRQGVALKVISGDNPRTVGAVAQRVSLPEAGAPIDARELPEDEAALAEVLETHSVFGRVTPHQKRAMVKALQARGHVVAMTGDGVNDALALKDADIGVAMGSGAPATRAVAQLVLLDGRFATLPGVVAEGRRVTANIERVANLFLTKTTYAALLAIAIAVTGWPFPFLPRHFTVISTLTIGVPAFFLALAPNTRRYLPGFVDRVLRFAIPAGTIAAACVFATYALGRQQGLSTREARTAATIVLMVIGLWVLVILARPFTVYRYALVAAMTGAFVVAVMFEPLRDLLRFALPPGDVVIGGLLIAVAGCALIEAWYRLAQRRAGTTAG
ncbi:MAG: HAD-IC family P-type ATPase [Actinobacteria bacterium]|nr:HAD-IC family P-type ATPase [Actinomycetota bacterium]